MKKIIFVAILSFMFSGAIISLASESKEEIARQQHNQKMREQWEKNKEKNKDFYKETKSYKQKTAEEQRNFDEDWAKRQKELESFKNNRQK